MTCGRSVVLRIPVRFALAASLFAVAVCTRALAQGDTTPPTVTDITADGTPLPDAILTSEPPSIVVTFSEDIDPATVSVDTFRLVRSGGDGTFGDGNEVEIVPVSVTLSPGNVATMDLTGVKLPNEEYRIRVQSTSASGYALLMDGTDDYVAFGDILNDVGLPFTVSAWVYRTDAASGGCVFISDDSSVYSGFWFCMDTAGTVVVHFGNAKGADGNTRRGKISSLTVDPSTWAHVACVVRGLADMTIYIDGEDALGTYTGNGGLMAHNASIAKAGIRTTWGPEPFDGMIDEVRVWTRARTRAEIRRDMYCRLEGSEPGLEAYWQFDEGSGQTVGDLSPNACDGVLGSGTGAEASDPAWVSGGSPLVAVADLAGNPLDGDNLGSFPSGDGTEGGDFVSTFTIDAPLPKVQSIAPAPDTVLAAEPANVTVIFTKDMDAATVNADSFRLTRSGGDGTFSDGNEVEIVADTVALTSPNVAEMDLTSATLGDDVYRVFVSAFVPPSGGLIADWRFDEGMGGGVRDVSGNGNDGGLVNFPGDGTEWVPGWITGALSFNGTDDFVNCGVGIPDQPMVVSQSAWVRTSSGGVILAKRHAGNYPWPTLLVEGGKAVISVDDSNYRNDIAGTANVADGQWHHIVGVKDGTSYAIYVDGRLENAATDGRAMDGNGNLHIGHHGSWGNYFTGLVDNVRIYDRVLSEDEIVSLASELPTLLDSVGNALDGEYFGSLPSGDGTAGGDFVCTFRIDTTPPTVLGTSPAGGATDASIRDPITVTFSETMDDSVPATVFTIVPGVAGTLSWADKLLVFTPDADLPSETFYTVTISTDAMDLAGLALVSPYTFTFTTHEDVPPTVISTDPSDGESDVLIDASIGVTFSEPMDQAATEAALSISPSVTGSFSWTGDTLVFVPASDLPHETDYTVTVDTGATDVFGNPLAAPYSFTFRVPDVIAPYVLSTSPTDAATDVPLSASVTVTFSEDMDPAATAAAFSIEPAVSGTPSVSGAVLTLDPSGGLESDTEYTVTVSTGATDLVGLGLAADYTFTFTTIDLTAPADVTGLSLTASSEEIAIAWRNPFDLDFAGVVVLRSVDEAPTGSPADGATYAAGSIIGNAVVLHVGTAATGTPGSMSGWSELGVEEGREYHYTLFTFDGRVNYSAGASASAVSGEGGGDTDTPFGGGCAAGAAGCTLALAGLLAIARRRK